jgi:phosphatidylserine synthase 2
VPLPAPSLTPLSPFRASFHALQHALFDEFVIAHVVGWAFKACMLRDVWISMAVSVLFELMEYTFVFIQPNFMECWWDHWILDFLICNTGGIIVGHAVMRYLDSREYNWAGIADTPTVGGKVSRALAQFTPYSWTPFDWQVSANFKRFCYVTIMVVATLVIELDAFFLKDILWVPPRSPLNVYRLLVWWAVGMVALRDFYAFVTDSSVKRLGATCWVVLAMWLMELIVVVKFSPELNKGQAIPPAVVAAWGAFFALSAVGLAVWFLIELPRRSGKPAPIPALAAAAEKVRAALGGHGAAVSNKAPHAKAAAEPAAASAEPEADAAPQRAPRRRR